MHQALYRKWRPQSFADVVGQSAVTDTLVKQIEMGKTSHAYLFSGSRGTGKTTCAKIFSKAINCENPFHGNPCNECPSCRGISSGEILDIVEIDAASNNGVDYVREMREEAIYTPANVKKRVYIIDEVHMFSTSAFNALLKIMEEPPPHVVFILATTELHKVPATVASRCQRFVFKRISYPAIAERLRFIAKNEGAELSAEAADYIAYLSDGAMRDALSLLDQCISVADANVTAETVENVVGLAGKKQTFELALAIADRDIGTALSKLNDIYTSGKNITGVLTELCEIFRDVLIARTASGQALPKISARYTDEELSELLDKFDNIRLCNAIETIQNTTGAIAVSSNKRIDAELCCVRLCESSDKTDTASLASRLSELENKLASGNFAPAKSAPPATAQTATPKTEAPRREEAKPATAQPAPKPSGAGSGNAGDIWKKILEAARGELSPGVVPLFGGVKSKLSENTLFVTSDNPFVFQMLTRSENMIILKRAAETAAPGVILKASNQVEADRPETSGIDEFLSGLPDMEGITVKE